MKISVNLATRPFVELRPFFARLRVAMAGLAVLALALAIVSHFFVIRLHKQQAQMDDLRRQTVAAQQEKLHDEARMRQPANAEVLDRAHFLNALFLKKSFSWTAVMMDLETVLPTGVQVTAIEPQTTADGNVIIRLRVAGDRDRAVQLVRNLERSSRFLQPRLSSESSQAKENGARGGGFAGPGANGAAGVPGAPAGVEFDILANYNPLPEGQAYPAVRAPRVSAASGAASAVVTGGASTIAGAAAATPRPGVVRRGSGVYPRDGVVLPPYRGGTAPAGATTPAARPAAGGGGSR